MHYETKIYSTRFNVIAENNIFYGKIIFKITEKEVADFYFNKAELVKDVHFPIFTGTPCISEEHCRVHFAKYLNYNRKESSI